MTYVTNRMIDNKFLIVTWKMKNDTEVINNRGSIPERDKTASSRERD